MYSFILQGGCLNRKRRMVKFRWALDCGLSVSNCYLAQINRCYIVTRVHCLGCHFQMFMILCKEWVIVCFFAVIFVSLLDNINLWCYTTWLWISLSSGWIYIESRNQFCLYFRCFLLSMVSLRVYFPSFYFWKLFFPLCVFFVLVVKYWKNITYSWSEDAIWPEN